jgi:hypothetical protein
VLRAFGSLTTLLVPFVVNVPKSAQATVISSPVEVPFAPVPVGPVPGTAIPTVSEKKVAPKAAESFVQNVPKSRPLPATPELVVAVESAIEACVLSAK